MNANVTPINIMPSSSCSDSMHIAIVSKINDELYALQTNQGVVFAEKAMSCLLRPRLGDQVLLCTVEGESFILAVLKTASEEHEIALSGKVAISATEDLSITTGKSYNLNADEIKQCSTKLTMNHKSMVSQSDAVAVKSNTVSVEANMSNTSINRAYFRAKEAVRWIENIETLNIGNWVQNIKHTLFSKAKNQVITASSDVKVDAKRIHMG